MRWEPALWVLCQFLPSLEAEMKGRSGILVLFLLVPSSLPGQRTPPGWGLRENGSNLWPSLSLMGKMSAQPPSSAPPMQLALPANHSFPLDPWAWIFGIN